jgi:hypothetical protein
VKLTRRQLVIAAAVGSTALKASAQSAPAAQAATDRAAQTATDKIRQNADTLAKFAISITTEPAFQFKA